MKSKVCLSCLLICSSLTVWAQPTESDGPIVAVTTLNSIESECWATVYDQRNLKGKSVTIYNNLDLKNLKLNDGAQWSGKIRSVEVGPAATLTLYGSENFQDPDHTVTARQTMFNFDALNWKRVKSLKLNCN